MAAYQKRTVATKVESVCLSWIRPVIGFLNAHYTIHFSAPIVEGIKPMIGRNVDINLSIDDAIKLRDDLAHWINEYYKLEGGMDAST